MEGTHPSHELVRNSYFSIFVALQAVACVTIYVLSHSPIQTMYPSLSEGCVAAYKSDCVMRQLWLRAALINALLFLVLASISFLKIPLRIFDKTWTVVILCCLLGGYYYALSLSNGTVDAMLPVVYLGAGLWMMCQSLCVIEVAHQVHRYILFATDPEATNTNRSAFKWYAMHLSCSLVTIVAAIYLMIFWTGAVSLVVSMNAPANKGLLIPGMIFLYIVLLSWYALLSYPNAECNSSASTNSSFSKAGAVIVFSIVFVLCLYAGVVHRRINDIARSFCESFGICTYCGFAMEELERETDVEKALLGGMKERDREEAGAGDVAGGMAGALGLVSTSGHNSPRLDSGHGFGGIRGLGGDNVGTGTGESSTLLGFRGSEDPRNYCKNSPEKSELLFLLAIGSCYVPLLVTSWGCVNGSPELISNASVNIVTVKVANSAMFIKLFSLVFTWIAFALTLVNSCRIDYSTAKNRINRSF